MRLLTKKKTAAKNEPVAKKGPGPVAAVEGKTAQASCRHRPSLLSLFTPLDSCALHQTSPPPRTSYSSLQHQQEKGLKSVVAKNAVLKKTEQARPTRRSYWSFNPPTSELSLSFSLCSHQYRFLSLSGTTQHDRPRTHKAAPPWIQVFALNKLGVFALNKFGTFEVPKEFLNMHQKAAVTTKIVRQVRVVCIWICLD